MGDKWEAWKALKVSRKWPEFSQNSWAQELGFSSYRRLYRACQVVYGVTPGLLRSVWRGGKKLASRSVRGRVRLWG